MSTQENDIIFEALKEKEDENEEVSACYCQVSGLSIPHYSDEH